MGRSLRGVSAALTVTFAMVGWATVGWAPAALALDSASGVESCRLVDGPAVRVALGVTSDRFVSGPNVLKGGVCSWHGTEPNCFVRSLTARVHKGNVGAVRAGFRTAKPFDREKRLGRDAYYATEKMPLGAAIAIDRLFVRMSEDSWVEFMISGRLGPGHVDLQRVAASLKLPRNAAR